MPPPNAASTIAVTSVIRQLRYSSTPRLMIAVRTPPTSCTRPVPTRLRMPSASLMMRDSSTPLCVESK